MEHEDVVSTNSNDDDQDWKVQSCEILNVPNMSVDDQCYGNTHENVKQTERGDEQTTCVEPHVDNYSED